MSSQTVDFKFSKEVPEYLTKAELFAASKDCLSYKIVKTDRNQLKKILTKLDYFAGGEQAMGAETWLAQEADIYGYLVIEDKEFNFEGSLFFKKSIGYDDDLYSFQVDCSLDENGFCGGYGRVINIEPLLVTLELGQTWGYLNSENGLVEVEVCSPEKNLYDWKAPEDWVGEPYIRRIDDHSN